MAAAFVVRGHWAGQNAAAATEGAAAVADGAGDGAGEPPVGQWPVGQWRVGQWPGVTDPDAFRAQVADWLTQDANPSTRRSYPLALGLPLTWVATPSPPGRPRPARPRPPALPGDRPKLAALHPLGEFADRLAPAPWRSPRSRPACSAVRCSSPGAQTDPTPKRWPRRCRPATGVNPPKGLIPTRSPGRLARSAGAAAGHQRSTPVTRDGSFRGACGSREPSALPHRKAPLERVSRILARALVKVRGDAWWVVSDKRRRPRPGQTAGTHGFR